MSKTKKKVTKKTSKKVSKKVEAKNLGSIEVNLTDLVKDIASAKREVTPAEKEATKLHKKLVKFCEKNGISIVGAVSMGDQGVFAYKNINCKNDLERLGLMNIVRMENN